MSGDNKKRKPGRPPGSKNKTALVRLDKAAAVVAAQVSALKAEDKLYTLGKDRRHHHDADGARLFAGGQRRKG
jgi:hypothetical protein